ncbi:MAG: NAD(P)/FAD-dependent oxidoreductase [Clostridia bacterium]|nr:NAD(P)/FAD-dependent oxidoreductase [Clostridia bacterium]
MYDLIIIGCGPAGLSAGIYAVRAGVRTLVIGKDSGALSKAVRIDNYFGTDGTVSGEELLNNAEKQYLSLGGEMLSAQVVAIEPIDGFLVKTDAGDFTSKAVVLAVGRKKTKPLIQGEEEFIGRGVSRCAICDAFFFRNKKVGILGNGEYAKSEAQQLLPFTKDITIFTNGKDLKFDTTLTVNTQKLSSVVGDTKVSAVVTADGENIPIDGLFIADETPGAFEFALKLGIGTQDGYISVDRDGKTSFPGIYAAGDCIGGLNQLSTAVGEGAVSGQRAAEYIKRNQGEKK